MAWNEQRYLNMKKKCARDISTGNKRAIDYMDHYKKMINIENYESAKAITEVLKPLNYFTEDTHDHIQRLNP